MPAQSFPRSPFRHIHREAIIGRSAQVSTRKWSKIRVMRPGPSTFRPHVSIDDIAKFMVTHDLPNSPITTSDGRLVGLIRREDGARPTSPLHRHEVTDAKLQP